MTLPRGMISEDNAREIKALLWEGQLTQEQIADRYEVSQPTISRILRGKDWGSVLWPDDTVGEMPLLRYKTILSLKRRKSAHQSHGRSTTEAQEIAAAVTDEMLKADGADDELRAIAKKPKGRKKA